MNLKDALTLATKYTNAKKTSEGFHVVKLSYGCVEARNESSGCLIDVEDLNDSYWEKREVAVEAASLKKIVAQISDPKLEVRRNSLYIEDSGLSFRLRGLPKSSLPHSVQPPDFSSTPVVPQDAVRALTLLSGVVDTVEGSGGFNMAGVRLTPFWSAAATSSTLTVAWHAVLPSDSEPVTVPYQLFKSLPQDEAMVQQTSDGKVWIRCGDQSRWSLPLIGSWPDAAVNDMISQCREEAASGERTVFTTLGDNVATLSKRALLIADRNTSYWLKVDDTELVLSSDGNGDEFVGQVKVDVSQALTLDDPRVGISPSDLSKVAAVVALSSDDDQIAMSLGPSTAPVVIWNGATIPVEAVVMPKRLA